MSGVPSTRRSFASACLPKNPRSPQSAFAKDTRRQCRRVPTRRVPYRIEAWRAGNG